MTQTLESSYRPLGQVQLPDWQGRQKYMHTTNTRHPVMCIGFEDYLQPVLALCAQAGHTGIVHVTMDEKVIPAGAAQRKPLAHVDGRFTREAGRWGHPQPGWLHYCNDVPTDRMPVIVAASAVGCAVYPGVFNGDPTSTGDCEHIRPQFTDRHVLPANQGFWLSPDCVHESLTFPVETRRTFLRIALDD